MRKSLLLLSLFGILNLFGCASGDKNTPETAEALFERAKELDKDGRTEEAIAKYNEVKNKFPYSKLATEAELAAADVSFRDESYPEAQAAYQLFRDLHPKHPQTPFVIFRLGLSSYHQIPDSIDRDLTITQTAIETFGELIKHFPDSEYVAEAQQKRLECLKKLAEKELYIANFYLKKEHWQSALTRVEGILTQHKGLGFDEKALARAVVAATQANRKDLSEKYLAQWKQEYPGSKELEEVKKQYVP